MNLAIEQGIARFQQLADEKDSSDFLSLILVFPDLGRDYWHLIDEGHRACKTNAVQNGLMLGQFHPSCDAPAAHNPQFAVNRAPLPLMVIRRMASHDILFLRDETGWVEAYKAMFGESRLPAAQSADGQGIGATVGVVPPADGRPAANQPDRVPTHGTPYADYARTVQLQQMQFPRSDSPLELSFILVTQVKELLFRMLYVELDTTRTQIRAGDLVDACRALSRAHRVQRVLLVSWDILTGMSATDFVSFREILGEASGRQSFMYRALECIMGNRDSSSLDYLRKYGSLHRIVDHEIDTPSLYDEVVAYLHRNVRQMSDAQRQRDVSRQYVASQEVEAAWLDIYREPTKYPAEYSLAEALIELSFQFSQWRATHLLVVERMIGTKVGTGGTEGAEWLRGVNEHRFFPELWDVRARISSARR